MRLLIASVVILGSGCNAKGSKHLSGETVPAACGLCIFKMEGLRGCHWAIEVDGKYYLAEGVLPQSHQPHGPDGMCNMPRQAVVDGDLLNGKFVATRFDLKPATNVPSHAAPPHSH